MSSLILATTVLASGGCSQSATPETEGTQDAALATDSDTSASPVQVVDHHLTAMKSGDLTSVMSDYADDAVVVAPGGLVKNQTPATGPGVFAGASEARRVFETLTAPDNIDGIKSMETRVEPLGEDVALLYWTQFKGQPTEVSGRDIFVVRNGKIEFQDIVPDAK